MVEVISLNYLRMSIVLCDATSKLRQAVYLSVMKFLRECSQATVLPAKVLPERKYDYDKNTLRYILVSYIHVCKEKKKKKKIRIHSPCNFYLVSSKQAHPSKRLILQ